jgi:hypothetical protein
MPPKRPSTANQMSLQKKRRIAENQRSATVHIPNSQPTASSLPVAPSPRNVSSSQHLSTSRYEYSNLLFTFSQFLLTCNERQTHNNMSGILHTPAQRVGRSGAEERNPSSVLGHHHLGKSCMYNSTILTFVNILNVIVKMMQMMMTMMILLIQQAL